MYLYVLSVELSATDETCALKFVNKNEDYLEKAISHPFIGENFKRNGNEFSNKFEPHSMHVWRGGTNIQNQSLVGLPYGNSPNEIKRTVGSYVPSQQTQTSETGDVYNAYKTYKDNRREPIIYSIGQGRFDPNEFKDLTQSAEPEKVDGLPAYVFSARPDGKGPDPPVMVVAIDARPGQKINKHIESVAKYHCGDIKKSKRSLYHYSYNFSSGILTPYLAPCDGNCKPTNGARRKRNLVTKRRRP